MKNVKYILVLAALSLTFSLGAVSIPQVHADSINSLQCQYNQEENWETTTEGCDLALTKQVSVNGGAYVSAEIPSAAPKALVGDTVDWEITVTNDSTSGLTPTGSVTVQDNLPAGVTFVSSNASAGTYASGVWTFILDGNLPATLVLTTTANTTGLVENIATLATYDQYDCDWTLDESGPYSDSNPANNSDNAYVDVVSPTPPVTVVTPVTPKPKAPAAPNTGFGVHITNPVQTLMAYILGAIGSFALAVTFRRMQTVKK